MATIKLTKSAVDALEPGKKPWIMYDTEIKGFGVRVGRSGRKVWIVEYRPGAGGRGVSTKRFTIADSRILTLDEARKAARTVLAKARLGDDLADKREKEREMPTIEEYSKVFMAEHVEAKRKAATAETYQDHFDRLIIPVIGNVKLHVATTELITNLHLKVGRENGEAIGLHLFNAMTNGVAHAAQRILN